MIDDAYSFISHLPSSKHSPLKLMGKNSEETLTGESSITSSAEKQKNLAAFGFLRGKGRYKITQQPFLSGRTDKM